MGLFVALKQAVFSIVATMLMVLQPSSPFLPHSVPSAPATQPSTTVNSSPVVPNTNPPTPVTPIPVPSADPIVHCKLFACGIVDMPSSQCAKSGCCVIGDQNIVMIDQNKCIQQQQAYAQTHGQLTTGNSSGGSDKVLVNIDDGGGLTKGSFYCYQDKVNYLANLQNQIRVSETIAESCDSVAGMTGQQCGSNCANASDIVACSKNCFDNAYSGCQDKNNHVGDLRRQLNSDVHAYCPY